MSLGSCDNCGAFIDTDSDSEAYIQVLPEGQDIKLDSCRCEECRNHFYVLFEQKGYL